MTSIFDIITLKNLYKLFSESTFELYDQNGEYIDTFNDLDEINKSKYRDYMVIYGHPIREGFVHVEVYIEENN